MVRGMMRERWSVLADHVRRARTDARLTRAELAERAGLSTKSIDRVEQGLPVRLSTLAQLERALGWETGRARSIIEETATEPGHDWRTEQEQSLLVDIAQSGLTPEKLRMIADRLDLESQRRVALEPEEIARRVRQIRALLRDLPADALRMVLALDLPDNHGSDRGNQSRTA